MFSFSSNSDYGHEPCNAVRKMIEKYCDEQMISSYQVVVYNPCGVFSPKA